jgi:hypothetical protein
MTLKSSRQRSIAEIRQLPPVTEQITTPVASISYVEDGAVIVGKHSVSLGAGTKNDVLVITQDHVQYNCPLDISEIRYGNANIRYTGSAWRVGNADFEIQGPDGDVFAFTVRGGKLVLQRNGNTVATFNTD